MASISDSYEYASWMWERDDGGFSPYPPEKSYNIETAYVSGVEQFTSVQYVIDFQTMTQHGGGVTRAVERVGINLEGVPTLGAYWVWLLSPGPRHFVPYDMDASVDMEITYQSGYSILDLSQSYSGLPYTVNFTDLKQTSLLFGTQRNIKRIALPHGVSLQSLLKIPSLNATAPAGQGLAISGGAQSSTSLLASSSATRTAKKSTHPLQVPSSTASHPLQSTRASTAAASAHTWTTAVSHPLKIPSSYSTRNFTATAAHLAKVPSSLTSTTAPMKVTSSRTSTTTGSHSATSKVASSHISTTAASHSAKIASSRTTTAASNVTSSRTTAPSRPLQAATSHSARTLAPAASNPAQVSTQGSSSSSHASTGSAKSGRTSNLASQPTTHRSSLPATSSSGITTWAPPKVSSKATALASSNTTHGATQTDSSEASSCQDDPLLSSYDLADDIVSSYSSHSEVPSAPSTSRTTRLKFLDFFKGAFSKYPRGWKPHPKSEDYLVFALPPACPEYRKVESRFKESLPNFTILSVKRVQNRWLWARYTQAKTQLAKKNAGAVNEMELFHGSKDTTSENICASEEGFDMRFSQQGLWGQANYFAVKAFYSHHYAYVLSNTEKEIILANVLTGDSIESQPNSTLRFPPEKTTKRGNLKQVRYDSVNGLTQGYRVYMTYCNDRAYPAYIITYSESREQ